MKSIFWDIAHFNVSMKSQCRDIYELENNISKLFGSSNFSEIDSLDWFLINKETKELSFLLLTIPSSIVSLYKHNVIDTNSLREINLFDCIDKFISDINIQDMAFFSIEENTLVIISCASLIYYKTLISDDLYFLLGEDLSYQGFLLVNALDHIPGKLNKLLDDKISDSLFLRMLALCNEEFYDAIFEKNEHYLSIINQLEKDCIIYQNRDGRLLQILEFIKNIKYTFYDIE